MMAWNGPDLSGFQNLTGLLMKGSACFLLLFSINPLGAQKIVKKSLVNHNNSFIQIDANNCFEVVMATAAQDEMIVEATIDGEYKKDLLLNIREEGTTVKVGAGFQPNFINPNDKLSAHKVISIALKIVVPENKNVQVYGNSCNISATGDYRNLSVALADGRCTLKDVSETVDVTTRSGNIYVISSNATITANTKYGKITEENIPKGNNRFVLKTTSGNINLKKTE